MPSSPRAPGGAAPQTAPLPEPVGVSFVMPVLNEARYLRAAVLSVLEQRFEGEREVILALGQSSDGTEAIAAALVDEDARIRLVRNPGTDIPIGLNLAIRAARYPVVVRVDAHTTLPVDYTELGIAALRRTGAANLGGLMHAVGAPGAQAAIAKAYNSRFGLGGGAYHGGQVSEGPAESAYMGIMRRDAVLGVGGFDETLKRGEDWDLNRRLREAGHLVWLEPSLVVSYWPRDTWAKLVRQFFATGRWRAELVRRSRGRNPLRYFAPPALLVLLVLVVVVALLQLLGVLGGVAGLVASAVYLVPLCYLGLLVVVCTRSGGSLLDRLRFARAIATMHLAWGAGFVVGVLRGARDAVDTSRAES